MKTITIKLNYEESECVLKSINIRNWRGVHPEETSCLEAVGKEISEQGDAIGWDEFFSRDIWDNSKN